MRGRLVQRRWEGDPARYAPARHRRACDYATFEPTIADKGGAFLEKPFSAEALMRKVREVLGQ